MKTTTLTSTQTRGLAKAFNASVRRQITIPQLAAACTKSRKAVKRPSNETLIDYLCEQFWIIDESDDIVCHNGAYTMRREDEQWKLTKHSNNRARIIEWQMTFTSAPDEVIIATLKTLSV